jgi:hypothetical protein
MNAYGSSEKECITFFRLVFGDYHHATTRLSFLNFVSQYYSILQSQDIEIQSLPKPVSSGKNLRKRSDRVSVPMARGKHLFPFRTQKLSLVAVTILHLCGKIARCRVIEKSLLIREAFSFYWNKKEYLSKHAVFWCKNILYKFFPLNWVEYYRIIVRTIY